MGMMRKLAAKVESRIERLKKPKVQIEHVPERSDISQTISIQQDTTAQDAREIYECSTEEARSDLSPEVKEKLRILDELQDSVDPIKSMKVSSVQEDLKKAVGNTLERYADRYLSPIWNTLKDNYLEPATEGLKDKLILSWLNLRERVRRMRASLSYPFLDSVFEDFEHMMDNKYPATPLFRNLAAMDPETQAMMAKLPRKVREQICLYHERSTFYSGATQDHQPMSDSVWPLILKEPFLYSFLDFLREKKIRITPSSHSFPYIKRLFTEFSSDELNKLLVENQQNVWLAGFESDLSYDDKWDHVYHVFRMLKDQPQLSQKTKELSYNSVPQIALMCDFFGRELMEKLFGRNYDKEIEDNYMYYHHGPILEGKKKNICLEYIMENVSKDQLGSLSMSQLFVIMTNLGVIVQSLPEEILDDSQLVKAIFDFKWSGTRSGTLDEMKFIKKCSVEFLKTKRDQIIALAGSAKQWGGEVLWDKLEQLPADETDGLIKGCDALAGLSSLKFEKPGEYHWGSRDLNNEMINMLMAAGKENLRPELISYINKVLSGSKDGHFFYEKKRNYINDKETYHLEYRRGGIRSQDIAQLLKLNSWLSNFPEQDYELILTQLGVTPEIVCILGYIKKGSIESDDLKMRLDYAKLSKFIEEQESSESKENLNTSKASLPKFLEFNTLQKQLFLKISEKKNLYYKWGKTLPENLIDLNNPENIELLTPWLEEGAASRWPLTALQQLKSNPRLKGLFYYVQDYNLYQDDKIFTILEEMMNAGLSDEYFLQGSTVQFDNRHKLQYSLHDGANYDVVQAVNRANLVAKYISKPHLGKAIGEYNYVSDIEEFILKLQPDDLSFCYGGDLKDEESINQAIKQSNRSVDFARFIEIKKSLSSLDKSTWRKKLFALSELDENNWEKFRKWPHLSEWVNSNYKVQDIIWILTTDETLLAEPKFWQYRLNESVVKNAPQTCLEILRSEKLPKLYTATWQMIEDGSDPDSTFEDLVKLRIEKPHLFRSPYIDVVENLSQLQTLNYSVSKENNADPFGYDTEEVEYSKEEIEIIKSYSDQYFIHPDYFDSCLEMHRNHELVSPSPEFDEELRRKCGGKYCWEILECLHNYMVNGVGEADVEKEFWKNHEKQSSEEYSLVFNSFIHNVENVLRQTNGVSLREMTYGRYLSFVTDNNLQDVFLEVLNNADDIEQQIFIFSSLASGENYPEIVEYKKTKKCWEGLAKIIEHRNFHIFQKLSKPWEILALPSEQTDVFMGNLRPEMVTFQKSIPDSLIYNLCELPQLYNHPKRENLLKFVNLINQSKSQDWYGNIRFSFSLLCFVDVDKALGQLQSLIEGTGNKINPKELAPILNSLGAKIDMTDLAILAHTFDEKVISFADTDSVLSKLGQMDPITRGQLFRNDKSGLMGWRIFDKTDELKQIGVSDADLKALTLLYQENNISFDKYLLKSWQIPILSSKIFRTGELVNIWSASDHTDETFDMILDGIIDAHHLAELFANIYYLESDTSIYNKFNISRRLKLATEIINNYQNFLYILSYEFFAEVIQNSEIQGHILRKSIEEKKLNQLLIYNGRLALVIFKSLGEDQKLRLAKELISNYDDCFAAMNNELFKTTLKNDEIKELLHDKCMEPSALLSIFHVGIDFANNVIQTFSKEEKAKAVKSLTLLYGDYRSASNRSLFGEAVDEVKQEFLNALGRSEYSMYDRTRMLQYIFMVSFSTQVSLNNGDISILSEKLSKITNESREEYINRFVGLLKHINSSNSDDVQKIKMELLHEIIEMPGTDADEQENLLKKLIAFFEKNNIPLCGKVAEIFRRIYSNKRIIDSFRLYKANRFTTVLQTLNPEEKPNNYERLMVLIRNDLLHTALRSNDSNLKSYFEKLNKFAPIIDKFQEISAKGSDKELQEFIDETPELASVFEIFTVVVDTIAGPISGNQPKTAEDFRKLEAHIINSFAIRGDGQISSIFIRNFFGNFGINSANEGLEYMDKVMNAATERNRLLAECGHVSLLPGDYVKGMGTKAINFVFSVGNKGKEFLGADTCESDSTPFDVDWTRVNDDIPNNLSFNQIIRGTSYPHYSASETGIGLIIKNRGQFYNDKDYNGARKAMGDIDGQYETVYSGVVGCDFAQHYGIRTAVPVSEFSAVVVNPEKIIEFETNLRIIKENIARSGIYIPISDVSGKIIYTFNEWKNLARVFENIHSAMDDKPGDGKFDEPFMQIVDGPSGSTPRKWFEDASGRRYLYKFYGDVLKSVNESFYCELYTRLGFKAPKTHLGKYNGKIAFVSEEILGATSANGGQQDIVEMEKIEGFVADCLFGNWDAPQNDNILFTEDKQKGVEIWRVDNGGAGIFRAADNECVSKKKTDEEFGETIHEFESFFDASKKGGYIKQKNKLYTDRLIAQAESIVAVLTPEILDEIYEKSGMLAAEMGEPRKSNEILKSRLKFLAKKVTAMKEQRKAEVKEQLKGRSFVELLSTYTKESDELLGKLTPLWAELTGEYGYQHNDDQVGAHTIRVLDALKSSKEYTSLSQADREIALLASFFHDFGKKHGKHGTRIGRDYQHDEKSSVIAERYLGDLGYDQATIDTVKLVILNDGQVSDWARGKNDGLTVESLRQRMNNNGQAIRILRAMNMADVSGLPDGSNTFARIADKYNEFFDRMIN